MEEKILIKSERGTNLFFVFAFLVYVGGLLPYLIWGGRLDNYILLRSGEPADFICVFGAILLVILGLLYNRTELVITDKRVYGKVALGKQVDLPLDSVTAVGSAWPNSITVATSSGRIKFAFIKNRNKIRKVISDLLIERQNKSLITTINQETHQSEADELKKYKELLDSGIITQDEFNAKKKQLLGL